MNPDHSDQDPSELRPFRFEVSTKALSEGRLSDLEIEDLNTPFASREEAWVWAGGENLVLVHIGWESHVSIGWDRKEPRRIAGVLLSIEDLAWHGQPENRAKLWLSGPHLAVLTCSQEYYESRFPGIQR